MDEILSNKEMTLYFAKDIASKMRALIYDQTSLSYFLCSVCEGGSEQS